MWSRGADPAEFHICETYDIIHHTFIVAGAYKFRNLVPSDRSFHHVGDDAACCPHHAHLWKLLVATMEASAAAGTFDPAMWAPTFPKRTVELVERSRAIVAAALDDKLPVVLIGVIGGFLFFSFGFIT